MILRRPLPTLALLSALAACAPVGPDYHPPRPDLPAAFSGAAAAHAAVSGKAARATPLAQWWTGFHDPLLNRLAARTLAGNLDVQIAGQRLEAARADRDAVAAAEQPTLGLGADYANERSSTLLAWPPGNGQYKTWDAGLQGSWEIDVFGGTRRAIEAADAASSMAEEDVNAAKVAVLGELVADYTLLRSDQHRLDIARRNIAAQNDSLALTRRALKAGLGTEVDVARAEAAVKLSSAQVPVLEGGVQRLAHAIAVLTGQPPETLTAALYDQGGHDLKAPPLPAALPSDLLRNRPDIRRAERRIAAATAQVGVATADLFPKFEIPLGIGPATSNFANLFNIDSLVWTLGLSARQSVLDGGKRDAHVRAAQAVSEADRLLYRRTVLDALREVEDRLTGIDTERRRHAFLVTAVEDDRIAFTQASRLYGAGLTDFLKVLDAERALFQAEDALAVSEAGEVLDIVGLYRAFGGGWQVSARSPST